MFHKQVESGFNFKKIQFLFFSISFQFVKQIEKNSILFSRTFFTFLIWVEPHHPLVFLINPKNMGIHGRDV